MDPSRDTSCLQPAFDAGIEVGEDPHPLLDAVLARFEGGDVDAAMRLLVGGLSDLRRALGPAWPTVAANELLSHPVRAWVHRCPMTRHAFLRPRGHAGDAELIDHLYGTPERPVEVGDPVAARIYRWVRHAPWAAAVRHRRERLARAVDEAAAEFTVPRVLAIGAGHLREFALSRAAQAGALASWTALDPDPLGVALVRGQLGGRGVTAVEGSVRQILAGHQRFEHQSLVYAAGPLDHLPACTARALVGRLYAALHPGGRLLIANFARGAVDAGYIESYMNWPLVLRDVADMRALFDELPPVARRGLRIDADPRGQLLYAELRRI